MKKSTRFDSLVIALRFGANRNSVIGGWKRINSTIRLLQQEYPRMLDYEWDLFLWGPNSSELLSEIELLIPSPIMGYLHERDTEPIHHHYVWERDEALFRESMESFWNNGSLSDKEKIDYIVDSIIWFTYVPSNLRVPKALSLKEPSEKREGNTVALSKKYEFSGRWKDIAIFSEDNISNLLQLYKSQGIKIDSTIANNKIKIPPQRVEMYKYLEPRYEKIEVEKEYVNADAFSLMGLIGQMTKQKKTMDLPGELSRRVARLGEEFNGNNLEKLKKNWEQEYSRLADLFDSTQRGGLSLSFEKNGVVFGMSSELRKNAQEKGYTCGDAYLNFYHTLQPLEHRVLMEN